MIHNAVLISISSSLKRFLLYKMSVPILKLFYIQPRVVKVEWWYLKFKLKSNKLKCHINVRETGRARRRSQRINLESLCKRKRMKSKAPIPAPWCWILSILAQVQTIILKTFLYIGLSNKTASWILHVWIWWIWLFAPNK